jgi:hypothetical protein
MPQLNENLEHDSLEDLNSIARPSGNQKSPTKLKQPGNANADVHNDPQGTDDGRCRCNSALPNSHSASRVSVSNLLANRRQTLRIKRSDPNDRDHNGDRRWLDANNPAIWEGDGDDNE